MTGYAGWIMPAPQALPMPTAAACTTFQTVAYSGTHNFTERIRDIRYRNQLETFDVF